MHRTLLEQTACFHAVAQLGFAIGERNGVELHKRTYYDRRAQYPDLPSQLVIAARVKATEATASALTWKRKHEASYPKKGRQMEEARQTSLAFQAWTRPPFALLSDQIRCQKLWSELAEYVRFPGNRGWTHSHPNASLQARGTLSWQQNLFC